MCFDDDILSVRNVRGLCLGYLNQLLFFLLNFFQQLKRGFALGVFDSLYGGGV